MQLFPSGRGNFLPVNLRMNNVSRRGGEKKGGVRRRVVDGRKWKEEDEKIEE